MSNVKIDKTLKNMIVIGGTVSTVAFGFSMISSKVSITRSINLGYSSGKWTPNITSINNVDNVEDLELKNGCKFVFYDASQKQTAFRDGLVKDTRSYLNGIQDETKRQKVIQEVKKHQGKCDKDRFIYSEIN